MGPEWLSRIPMEVVSECAIRHNLDPILVAAVIQTESSGNPFAIRAELKKLLDEQGRDIFLSLWKYPLSPLTFAEKLHCTLATEWAAQATSWGPMQVMGTVAREHGFEGWFPELCSWTLGVEYGCKRLRLKADTYGDDPATLYAAYNSGSPRMTAGGMFVNQRNVDHFMGHYRHAREY